MKNDSRRNSIPLVIIIIIFVIASFGLGVFTSIKKTKSDLSLKQSLSETEISQAIANGEITDNEILNEITDGNEVMDADNSVIEPQVDKKDLEGEAKTKYYIKVNLAQNTVTIYQNDNGTYKPMKAMVCSVGGHTPTSGIYILPGKKRVWGTLFGHGPYKYVYGHYVTNIVGNILFHSVPYIRNGDPASLEYEEYNKLGTKASAGCVRLAVADSKWIFDNIPKGTPVEFYSDSNPGPLGKPIPINIPVDNEKVRDWDPTDSNPSNPWHDKSNLIINEQDKKQDKNQDNKQDAPVNNKDTNTEKKTNPTNEQKEEKEHTNTINNTKNNNSLENNIAKNETKNIIQNEVKKKNDLEEDKISNSLVDDN